MRRREAPWSECRHGFLQGSASSLRSSVLLQSAQSPCDVIGEGEEPTHSDPGRHDASLQFLRRQRRLLTLAQEFVFHQMRVLEYCKMVEQTALPGLEATCLRLQELCHGGALLQRKVQADQRLRPLSPLLHRSLQNMRRTLQLMSVKAAIVTEERVLSAVRRAARIPAEAPGSLCRALIIYNKVLTYVSPWAAPRKDLYLMSITRSLEIIAQERGRLMVGHFSSHRLEEASGALLSRLESLIQEDKGLVAPLLRVVGGLDHVVEGQSLRSRDGLLYAQYCSHLWPVLSTYLFQALYPGRHGVQAMPGLMPCAVGKRTTAIIQSLQSMLTSDAVPEQCRESGRHLCHHLLCTAAFISWDTGMCRALSLALTDKCVTSLLDAGARRTHSRTSEALVTVCQESSVLLHALSSAGDVSGQQAVLSRCVASLQLCDLWLRSRSQVYNSSGSLGHLLLISHGDLPVIKDQMRSVNAAARGVEWSPVSQRLCVKLQNVVESLEGVALCVPRLLGAVCTHHAQDIFQHTMPAGRHWRGKRVDGPDLVPSEYARAAVNAVLVPLLDGVRPLSLEEQMSAVCLSVGVFMEAWMEHILQERPRFSLQGALQLRCDFESVRELLKSPELGLSPEVLQAVLSLPVFQQADNAIVCLLQQPSRKTYLQTRGCSVFCCPPLCRTTVDSVSDSLQSLDSLGRRVWSHNYPAQQPRHSHDSYLPHNQRQWLSLRLHKGWNGLG
ncbi:coiled-coil domain-containing protein 142 isoform X1 [Bufo gargarizans]|uniref:coiled-coil domain-containing protein 142 isoform X1 n=1 Tax=Bufo gargarizans TaxID=30331 RepID=UPI001CF4F0C0|nr:coiled-coil domain-containing protein 142 isoform X1 [Bufo gargarizans]